jgi:predicted transcriptional regulator
MRLAEYLASIGISEAEFARRALLPQRTVNRVCNGAGIHLDTARKIVKATGGLVGFDDLAPAEAAAEHEVERAAG